MNTLEIIACYFVQGRGWWLVLTFDNYPMRLCIKISDSDGSRLLNALFGFCVRDSREIIGKTLLAAELPTQKGAHWCWEEIEPAKPEVAT